MAKIDGRATITVEVPFTLTENEARALHALTEYGTDAFLKNFYTLLGESCLKPHEAGIRTLFESIRQQLPPVLDRADKARLAFSRG